MLNESTSQKQAIYLKDYTPPAYLIDEVSLVFVLSDTKTHVTNTMQIRPNPALSTHGSLVLNGEGIQLEGIALNGRTLSDSDYEVNAQTLTVHDVPESAFTLTVTNTCNPKANTALSGLYHTHGNFCTQCEPHGFRRITYYIDRPDVLASFTTQVIGDKSKLPFLLSNGNAVEAKDLPGGQHTVTWVDPHKKPCYLFALVAGDYAELTDTFTTASGRDVDIRFYVAHHNKDKVAHAINALKKSMRWDEQTYGLEYDLDIYMVVAAEDFNSGAMENKGLNVFNTKYVLADEATATDTDFLNIEAVIGHEYFHNWSGNRVTCRDWFQLSLKEGFTVLREQQFAAFCGSESVQRIDEVNLIRTRQFAEDAGPMAHPVRPAAYIEINNFYTLTVYHKGAEVIRMLKTLVGDDGFYKGVDLYFERHDGQAVTCDDYVAAIADANQIDLTQFKRWYAQAGTPVVHVESTYADNTYTLTFMQETPPTADGSAKEPFVIPVKTQLLAENGQIIEPSTVLNISEQTQRFTFNNVKTAPIPALLAGFSAPVKCHYPYTAKERLVLLAHCSDSFSRWDAAQQLIVDYLLSRESAPGEGALRRALISVLEDEALDTALIARILTMPSLAYLATCQQPVQVNDWLNGIRYFEQALARAAEPVLLKRYTALASVATGHGAEAIGARALRNVCLYYLVRANEAHLDLVRTQYDTAPNMTTRLGALQAINNLTCDLRRALLDDFYQRFEKDALVIDKWFSLQARADRADSLAAVKSLMSHSAFNLKNPNKVYALIGGFAANPRAFHKIDGSGYTFLQEVVAQLDTMNPQVAARMVGPFTEIGQYDEKRQEMMRKCVEKLLSVDISPDLYEIATKILKQ